MVDDGLVNTIGLLLDVIGVILVFRFGLAPDVPREASGGFLVLNGPTEAQKEEARAKWRRYRYLSYLGLLLLVLGFILQIVSNYV